MHHNRGTSRTGERGGVFRQRERGLPPVTGSPPEAQMSADEATSRRIHLARPRSMRERGYGVGHRQRRRVLAPIVAKGLVDCARCGEPIEPGEPWDLGHDDFDRSRYLGPEHRRCNRAAPNQLRVSRDW